MLARPAYRVLRARIHKRFKNSVKAVGRRILLREIWRWQQRGDGDRRKRINCSRQVDLLQPNRQSLPLVIKTNCRARLERNICPSRIQQLAATHRCLDRNLYEVSDTGVAALRTGCLQTIPLVPMQPSLPRGRGKADMRDLSCLQIPRTNDVAPALSWHGSRHCKLDQRTTDCRGNTIAGGHPCSPRQQRARLVLASSRTLESAAGADTEEYRSPGLATLSAWLRQISRVA